jgi:hypothetical protein
MIGYMGKKMLMLGNFKEYMVGKKQIIRVINEKKELFVVKLKGDIPEDKSDEYINFTPIIRSIEICNK